MSQYPTATTNGHERRDAPERRPDPRRTERRRRIRRIVWWVLGVIAVVVIVASVFAGIQTIGIRERLTEGRDALDRAQDAVTEGDLGVAQRSFADAADAFSRARADASGPAYSIVGAVPLLGRTPRAVEGITAAGEELAAAGTALTDGLASLPEGLGSLSPSRGRVPLEPIETLAEAAAQARAHTEAAAEAIEDTPSTLLAGPLGEVRLEAAEAVDRADAAVRAGSLLLDGLPAFLGADGPARYFVAAENPAELRGTGGIMGAYSILTIDRGRFSFGEFRPVQEFSRPAEWQNVNISSDFAGVVGPRIVEQYEAETGQQLDGAIAVDPFALAELLEVTGPVELGGLGVELDANTVVDFTANEAFSEFTDPEIRKAVLGEAALQVFLRFLAGGEGIDGIRAIGTAASEGHLTVYSTDPTMQQGLVEAGAAGALRAIEGEDFLAVVENNGAGNKVDFYATRTVDYAVDLLADGHGRGHTEITFANDAPVSGQPAYVIGPFDRRFEAGETLALVDVLCAPGCAVDRLERGGGEIEPTASGTVGGIPYVSDAFSIPAGEQESLVVDKSLSRAWEGNSSGGTYRLRFQDQTTIRPTRLQVVIRPPEGMELTTVSDGVTERDGAAVWTGEAAARTDIEVSFSAPVPGRWWRNVTRWLAQPAV